jgi:hypothetical protein
MVIRLYLIDGKMFLVFMIISRLYLIDGKILSRSLREARKAHCWAWAFFEVHLLDCLLVESFPRLVLTGGVLALVLALARVVLVEGVLVLLGAVGDGVVGVSIVIASFLRTTTALAI